MQEFSALKTTKFTFKENQTLYIEGGPNGTETDKYNLNEATTEITINSPKDGKQEGKASFKNGRLQLSMQQSNGMLFIMEFGK